MCVCVCVFIGKTDLYLQNAFNLIILYVDVIFMGLYGRRYGGRKCYLSVSNKLIYKFINIIIITNNTITKGTME